MPVDSPLFQEIQNPENPEKQLDTSLPGREEEVINQKEKSRPTNSSDIPAERPDQSETRGEDQFKQGMGNNDTRGPENEIEKAGSLKRNTGEE
ncbi:MAG: hypothetical protein ABIP80_01675 [Ferruginibacter sp.]